MVPSILVEPDEGYSVMTKRRPQIISKVWAETGHPGWSDFPHRRQHPSGPSALVTLMYHGVQIVR